MGGYHVNSAALDENICQWVNKQVMLKLILILCGCLIIIDCFFNLQYTGIITKHKTIIQFVPNIRVCTHTHIQSRTTLCVCLLYWCYVHCLTFTIIFTITGHIPVPTGENCTGTFISVSRHLPSLDPATAARMIMVDGCAPRRVPSSNCQQSSIVGQGSGVLQWCIR